MPTLVEQLGKDPVRPDVINDCVGLIDAQVKQKGFMIKSAYAVIQTGERRFYGCFIFKKGVIPPEA